MWMKKAWKYLGVRIMKSFKEFIIEERDEDFGNFDGWLASIEEMWPEGKLTGSLGAGYKFMLYSNKVVGEWNNKTNKGYILMSDE